MNEITQKMRDNYHILMMGNKFKNRNTSYFDGHMPSSKEQKNNQSQSALFLYSKKINSESDNANHNSRTRERVSIRMGMDVGLFYAAH